MPGRSFGVRNLGGFGDYAFFWGRISGYAFCLGQPTFLGVVRLFLGFRGNPRNLTSLGSPGKYKCMCIYIYGPWMYLYIYT